MSKRAYLLGMFLMPFLLSPSWAGEASWIMPVQDEDLSPFKHQKGGTPGGIEVDLTRMIAKKVGAPLSFKTLGVSEGRRDFLTGDVTVDCCLAKIWFPGPENDAAQVFSDPLYRMMEIWFFPPNMSFPIKTTKDLKDKRVAAIRGFTYPGQDDFGARIDGGDVESVFKLLLDGKADVAVLERHAAKYVIDRGNLKVEFGPPYYDVQVGLRLHRSLAAWLPKVNKAIAELKAEGGIEAIIRANMQ